MQCDRLMLKVAKRFKELSSILLRYGIGFMIASQAAVTQRPDVVVRPLAGRSPMLTTYLLRSETEPSGPLARFIDRVSRSDQQAQELPGIDPAGYGSTRVDENRSLPDSPCPRLR
jgi:hypothetical protein